MKFTLPWLKEHLETEAAADEIARTLTALGLEVEDVHDRTGELAAFSVGRVIEAVQHPNADRLRLCTVETAEGVMQVVCGAPNARTGLHGIFAPTGSTIPATGMVLTASKIRGVESQGMLCSARELGIGDDHDGIIELAGSPEVGTPAASVLGLEGPVFEVGLTPDRADCFGVVGIARELAAAGLGRLKSRDFTAVPSRGRGPAIRLDFPEGQERSCPLFIGRLIRGVTNGPSPDWMQRRLKAIGLRPISALVDITNYVMFDLNRPLHVFDAAKLEGDVTVRFARPGETLLALDGKEYALNDGMTVIADGHRPHGLGGVMGGEESGVTAETTDVLLEVALFDPLRTALTGRRLDLVSDARTRFERGLDPAMALPGMEHATRLILELCGGEAAEPVVAGEAPGLPAPVLFPVKELARLGGIQLEQAEIERHLRALGFALDGGPEHYVVQPPSWRHDVTSSACIVEELCRLHGYDRIPPVPMTRTEAVSGGVLSGEQRRRGYLRRTIAGLGYTEAVTWSFTGAAEAAIFAEGAAPVRLRNPISSELSVMRPSLLPNLLVALARNQDKKRGDGGLFELGARFTGGQPGQQVDALAGLRWGSAGGRHWLAERRDVDLFDVKADAMAVLTAAGVRMEALQVAAEASAWFHPGRSGSLGLGPNRLASFGELHPKVLERFDIDGRVVAFELDLDRLPKIKTRAGRTRPPLEAWPYPPVDRDFAFILDDSVTAEQLVKAVKGAEKKLVREVELFDVYVGEGVVPGKKSLAVAVRLQSRERTLTEADIEPVAKRIVAAVEKQLGGALRA
jgi:phenylalanyl-tRNA synthetase beta chain